MSSLMFLIHNQTHDIGNKNKIRLYILVMSHSHSSRHVVNKWMMTPYTIDIFVLVRIYYRGFCCFNLAFILVSTVRKGNTWRTLNYSRICIWIRKHLRNFLIGIRLCRFKRFSDTIVSIPCAAAAFWAPAAHAALNCWAWHWPLEIA